MKVTPQLIALVQDATLKSFWRKNALRQFLRGCGVQEAFLATWHSDETKRDFLFRLFEALQKSKNGEAGIRKMSVFLAEQTAFPDLVGWEDSPAKVADAKTSVSALADFIRTQEAEVISERERQITRTRFEELKQQRIEQTV